MNTPKDLNLEPPRSPRERLGGYAILARCLDKGHAELNKTAGEYHFDCPLDKSLFTFKGVNGEDVRKLLADGAGDDEVLEWLNTHGSSKSAKEVSDWSDSVEAVLPFEDPDKEEWFAGECERLGLDPAKTTLFDMLEADDRQAALVGA